MAVQECTVNELSSKEHRFTILDEAGNPVAASDLTVATLTLIDEETFKAGASPATGIIYNTDHLNILNANFVTIHATSGLVIWDSQSLHNQIVTKRRQIERHGAYFHFEFASGVYNEKIYINVKNLHAVP